MEPYLIEKISDPDSISSAWNVINTEKEEWEYDFSTSITCNDIEGDSTIFLDSAIFSNEITGYYIRQYVDEKSLDTSEYIYTRIMNDIFSLDLKLTYLYKFNQKWFIGDTIGSENCLISDGGTTDSGSCLAYNIADELTPNTIKSSGWFFLNVNQAQSGVPNWINDECRIYFNPKVRLTDHYGYIENIFDVLRYERILKFLPDGQTFIKLRNGLIMPLMGLGTGGLYPEQTFDTLVTSQRLGYRLFDLAREYNNEEIFSQVLDLAREDHSLPLRDDLFIETKVWPTHLGFFPTSDSIETSLQHLNTNYIDLYLLHWPM